MAAVNYNKTKYACYLTSVSMAAFGNISPLLFVTFHNVYGFSYTSLGFLVLVNFCSQLFIDLVFTFFEKYFNLKRIVNLMPVLLIFGALIYALVPLLAPEYTYIALLSGTALFSVSMGLGEVLTSPIVAAIPAENPDKEVSKLHAAYAWGTVVVVIISTVFIRLVKSENWFYLPLLWCVIPFASFLLFVSSSLPPMAKETSGGRKGEKVFSKGALLCTACIFFGGAAECTMTQWVSGFAENALGFSKVTGDVFGMALFALFLGIGRTVYTNYGKDIEKFLLYGMAGSAVCYVVASLSPSPWLGLCACALMGFSTCMLWPGTIIYTGEKLPYCPVAIYALLAAGGDLGASLSPQLLGYIADKVALSFFAAELSQRLSLTNEQLGLKAAMLFATAFPLVGFFTVLKMKKYFAENKQPKAGS